MIGERCRRSIDFARRGLTRPPRTAKSSDCTAPKTLISRLTRSAMRSTSSRSAPELMASPTASTRRPAPIETEHESITRMRCGSTSLAAALAACTVPESAAAMCTETTPSRHSRSRRYVWARSDTAGCDERGTPGAGEDALDEPVQRDVHAVEVLLVAQRQRQRHRHHAELDGLVLGQVGGRVGDQAQGRGAAGELLQHHVVDLGALDVPELGDRRRRTAAARWCGCARAGAPRRRPRPATRRARRSAP